jgi:hypothetical protein
MYELSVCPPVPQTVRMHSNIVHRNIWMECNWKYDGKVYITGGLLWCTPTKLTGPEAAGWGVLLEKHAIKRCSLCTEIWLSQQIERIVPTFRWHKKHNLHHAMGPDTCTKHKPLSFRTGILGYPSKLRQRRGPRPQGVPSILPQKHTSYTTIQWHGHSDLTPSM